MGKIARTFVSVLPGAGRPGATPEAGALAIWGVIGGAISAVSLAALFTRVEDDRAARARGDAADARVPAVLVHGEPRAQRHAGVRVRAGVAGAGGRGLRASARVERAGA